MKKAGCYLVDCGIESASPRMLKRMRKGITLEQIENVIRWTNEAGIRMKAFFTFGHIEETPEDAGQTVAFIRSHLHDITEMGTSVGLRVYPGTEVERFAIENGLLPGFSWSAPYEDERNRRLNSPSNIPLLLQPQLGFDELVEINKRILSFKARSPKFILRKILHAHSNEDLRRYWKNLKKLVGTKP